MATNRNTSKTKGTTGNKNKGTTKNTSRSNTAARKKQQRALDLPDISRKPGISPASEMVLWLMLAFCVLFFLSNTVHLGGRVGNAVSYFFFGLFGVVAYLMPFILFFSTAFLIANKGKKKVISKLFFGILFLISVSCFCEMVSSSIDGSRTLAGYYYSSGDLRIGGGLAGGIICRLFYPILGLIGTWIYNILIFVISVIGLTGYSFFDNLRKESGSALGDARVRKNMKRELNHQKKKNQRLQKQVRMQQQIEEIRSENEGLKSEIREPRRSRVITGVSTDTTFDTTLPGSEEVHEVVPKRSSKKSRKTASEESVRTVQKRRNQTQGEDQVIQVESRAAKMVESVKPGEEAKQLGMSFTIERNGSAHQVSTAEPAFTAAEHQSQNTEIPTMPELVKTGEKLIHSLEAVKPESGITEQEEHSISEERNQEDPGKVRLKNPHSSKEEQQNAVDSVAREIEQASEAPKKEYVFPPVELLKKPSGNAQGESNDEVAETAAKLQNTLHNFGVNVTITNVSCGPAVTRYELLPEQGVKVSRIVNLSDDIKLNLAAADIRIEAPIPGKAAVGIEVPNKENSAVYLRELFESDEFKKAESPLSFAVGKDIAGKVVVTDIAKMPHLLIAGATGSGKSVCINTLIMSILYKANPEDVKLIMIDPKVVELSVYNGIPHLFIPVVTDPKKASGALNWAVAEMTDRYEKFAAAGVRDLKGYNKKVEALGDIESPDKPKKLPQIVIIVDELADLMMVAPGEVEDAICRLAQLARAAGIHLIIATQRPSVNVITGLIKANMPSRIAFAVTSSVDSRTILDMGGAEKLLGKGDMLFYPQGYPKPVRVQGSFVSDSEVGDVTEFLTQKNDMSAYNRDMEERISKVSKAASVSSGVSSDAGELDSNFAEAGKFIIEKDKASIGMLQRSFKIGFNRAARIMDQLADAGVVGPEEGTKPRKVLMSMEEFEQYIDEYV